jgi:hypothetical protein
MGSILNIFEKLEKYQIIFDTDRKNVIIELAVLDPC